MKNTGKLLKDKRESANLSISEVALATKINPKILTAIENGDSANLPAKTFLKGFLRSYALFLKMDTEEVLRSYQDEMGGPVPERVHEAYAKPAQSTTPTPPPRRRVNEENSSGTRTIAVVVIVLLIGLIIGVRELIEKYQREKVVESAQNLKLSPLEQPPVTVVPLENVNATPPVATAEVTPEVKPEVKPVEVKLAEVAAKVEPTKAEPPKPTPALAPAPVKQAAAPKPPEPAPASETKPTPLSAPEVKAAEKPLGKKIKAEIILEALEKVDIKFKIKGETKTVSLAPNEVHTIHTDQPVIFDFSDGGAVNIILNGHERGVPGDLGKPKQVTLP